MLAYLYAPDRPRRVSILDVADEAGLAPAEAFREVQALTTAGLIGQELSFDVTFARGVPRSTRDLAARAFDAVEALLGIGEDLDASPVLALRPASAEVTRRIGRPVPPHELLQMLRALRQHGLLRLDKRGRGRYAVDFEPTFVDARTRLRRVRRTAEAVLGWVDARLSGRSGRDLVVSFDITRFLDEERRLTETFTHEDAVDACLLLHHLEAWHLSDPPVLFQSAMRVRVDPRARARDLDLGRPRRHYEHEVGLVHMMRRYAELPPERRAAYLDDYFALTRRELARRWMRGEGRAMRRPVSPRTEARILDGLTDAQRDAVTAEDRALLVVAGPGSGKTHTVVRRIEHMVRARQIRPDEILVLAFNRSAAAELGRRLEDRLGERGRRVDVRTFHSLALMLTGDDLREDRDPEARLDEAMARAAELLSGDEDPDGAEELRRRALGSVRHVLVDEYQDLDPDQYRLLAALVGLEARRGDGRERTERTVYVVGDDDQAIYGFRNASVEFLRRFEDEFGARRVSLSESFRSNARIVQAASRFAHTLPGRLKQTEAEQMRPAPGAPEGGERAVRRFRYRDAGELSAHVAWMVQRSLDAAPGTVAVLARHWSSLGDVRCLLEEAGVPFTIHHRDFHRPAHRRHPAERVVRALWQERGVIEGPAEAHVRALAGDRSSEPPVAELAAYAAEVDRERVPPGGGPLVPIPGPELADALVLAARDAALRDGGAGGDTRVHLCTFHGAKGLEFDKVIVLPATAGADAEERRAFFVAVTRARTELVVTLAGGAGELGAEVEAPLEDLRGLGARLTRARAGYLDCTPADVKLTGSELAPAQRAIAALGEGAPLEIEVSGARVALRHGGEIVGLLSASGRRALDGLRRRCPGPLAARVHEVFVHLVRDREGRVRRRWLAVLPTIRAGEGRIPARR